MAFLIKGLAKKEHDNELILWNPWISHWEFK